MSESDWTVTSYDIDNLGGKFTDKKTDLQKPTDGVNNLTVTAGDFQEAHDLEKTVTQRAGEAHTLLTNVGNTADGIGKDLKTVSWDYSATEADNKNKTSELDPLVKDAEKNLPDILKEPSVYQPKGPKN